MHTDQDNQDVKKKKARVILRQWERADRVQGIRMPAESALLGAGHFSKVYSLAEPQGHFLDALPGYVLKIGRGPYQGRYGVPFEDGGLSYAVWCMLNPGPLVPEVLGVVVKRSSYAVIIKEYKPVSWAYLEGQQAAQVAALVHGLQAVASPLLHNEYYIANTVESFTRERWRSGAIWDMYSEYFAQSEKIKGWIKSRADLVTDLHNDNVMCDPVTGDLVVTDPVSFAKPDCTKDFLYAVGSSADLTVHPGLLEDADEGPRVADNSKGHAEGTTGNPDRALRDEARRPCYARRERVSPEVLSLRHLRAQ